jgi:phospholipid-translocating ATPase
MRKAVEQFFPDDGILELAEVHPPEETSTEEPKPGNLRRAATGLSEILDEDNGSKPGGYILVIDGAALTHVRSSTSLPP